MPLAAGDKLGRYEIVAPIGAGGEAGLKVGKVTPARGLIVSVPTGVCANTAAESFISHCESQNLAFSTVRKYRNTLARLQDFCGPNTIDTVDEIDLDSLDRFRSGRGLAALSAA